VNLGAVFARLGRHAHARAQYRRALAIDGDHAAAHFNLGLSLRETGDLDGAERAFTRAAAPSRSAPHPRASLELGLLAAERGDYPRAAEQLERAVAVSASGADASLYANLGLARLRAGDRHGAREALERALELDPSHPYALTHLAQLRAGDGRYDEAAELLRRARARGNSDDGPASK
jgi:Tfp pilus assembly protein PilF